MTILTTDMLLAIGGANLIDIFDISTVNWVSSEQHTVTGGGVTGNSGVNASFNPDNSLLAVCSAEVNAVDIIDTSNWTIAQTLRTTDYAPTVGATGSNANDVSFSHDGQYLAIADNDRSGGVYIVRTSDWGLEQAIQPGGLRYFMAAKFNRDDQYIWIGTRSNSGFYQYRTSDWGLEWSNGLAPWGIRPGHNNFYVYVVQSSGNCRIYEQASKTEVYASTFNTGGRATDCMPDDSYFGYRGNVSNSNQDGATKVDDGTQYALGAGYQAPSCLATWDNKYLVFTGNTSDQIARYEAPTWTRTAFDCVLNGRPKGLAKPWPAIPVVPDHNPLMLGRPF